MGQELEGPAGVLGGHEVGPGQGLDGPAAEIAEVAKRAANQVEARGQLGGAPAGQVRRARRGLHEGLEAVEIGAVAKRIVFERIVVAIRKVFERIVVAISVVVKWIVAERAAVGVRIVTERAAVGVRIVAELVEAGASARSVPALSGECHQRSLACGGGAGRQPR
jgi:hypothetical protein